MIIKGATGKIKFINEEKNFGIISVDNVEKDAIFWLNKNNHQKVAFREGMRVNFNLTASDKKNNNANNVEPLNSKELNLKKTVSGGTQMGDKDFFLEYALDLKDNHDIYDGFCNKAETYAKKLKGRDKEKNVTTSMIRKIYSRIMNAENAYNLKLLRPQFAYMTGKNPGNYLLADFMNLLDELVKKIGTDSKGKKVSKEVEKNQIKSFQMFMEAIVAYRKYAGKDQ